MAGVSLIRWLGKQHGGDRRRDLDKVEGAMGTRGEQATGTGARAQLAALEKQ